MTPNPQSPAPGVAIERFEPECDGDGARMNVYSNGDYVRYSDHIAALQASAAAVEPVGEVLEGASMAIMYDVLSPGTKLYTAPPLPAQVPEAELGDAAEDHIRGLAEKCGARMPSMAGFPTGALWFTPEALIRFYAARTPAPGMAGGVGALSVRYVKMPESCGRNNWTALLYSADKSESFTIARSEYPHRVRYEADRVRHIIGELAERPHILDYDANERTPCHLCGGSGVKDGAPCPGLKFDGTAHDTAPHPSPAPQAAGAGLSLTQESKYTINGNAIVNRASGEAIPPDEPIFIFRARDRQACSIIGEYAQLCENAAHREAVNERFIQFGEWAEANPDRMKEPDTAAITASGRDAS